MACTRMGELGNRGVGCYMVLELGGRKRCAEDDLCECYWRVVLCRVSFLHVFRVFLFLILDLL